MYYLRQQTKVSGPFSATQLRGMLHRGRVARSDKVSTDRQSWVPVADCSDIVGAAVAAPVQSAAATTPAAAPVRANDGFVWHYTVHGVQQETTADTLALQNLVVTGEVAPEELVWRDGFLDWVAVRDVAELAEAVAAAQAASAQPFDFFRGGGG
ncbi:MAG: DUF4339 domain-containing protein [Planctomycetia bacterium]|jgi:hypothetical protein|nr:DUF4339 domain-containing protein [Planctomycetia bacterium]